MRKKLFVGIAVFAMIFSTCMTGYAQSVPTGTEATVACPSCTKCPDWHIPAARCATLGQGETASTVIFDWDATYGYCEQGLSSTPTANRDVRNCKLIFNLCNCDPDACDFEVGWVVGIQLRILEPGVYFAPDANLPAFPLAGTNCYSSNTYQLNFKRFPEGAATTEYYPTTTCADPQPMQDTATYAMDQLKVSFYANEAAADAGIPLTGPGAAGANRATVVRTPTPYDGWEISEDDARRNLCEWWIDMPAMIAAGSITPGNHVLVEASLFVAEPLEMDAAGYADRSYLRPQPATVDGTINTDWMDGTPPFEAQGQYWLNSPDTTYIPAGYDCYDKEAPLWAPCSDTGMWGAGCCTAPPCAAYVAQAPCDPDQTLLTGTGACAWTWRGDEQICSRCKICKCIVDVGILCCDTPEGDYCLLFPYVINGLDDWSTGIGLSSLCAIPAGLTPEVTLTLTDCEGGVFTHTVSPFNNCLGNGGMTIDMMASEWGWNPAAGQGFLRVNSNVVVDGYQFNMFNSGGLVFGAGVLGEACWAGCVRGTSDTKYTK